MELNIDTIYRTYLFNLPSLFGNQIRQTFTLDVPFFYLFTDLLIQDVGNYRALFPICTVRSACKSLLFGIKMVFLLF